jgi:hypothetical protein
MNDRLKTIDADLDICRAATKRPWQYSGVRPFTVHDGGELEIHHDADYAHFNIKRVYLDDQGRRCTRFMAQVHIGAPGLPEQVEQARRDAEFIVAACNGYEGALEELKAFNEGSQRG